MLGFQLDRRQIWQCKTNVRQGCTGMQGKNTQLPVLSKILSYGTICGGHQRDRYASEYVSKRTLGLENRIVFQMNRGDSDWVSQEAKEGEQFGKEQN